jgi:hypothetical protein
MSFPIYHCNYVFFVKIAVAFGEKEHPNEIHGMIVDKYKIKNWCKKENSFADYNIIKNSDYKEESWFTEIDGQYNGIDMLITDKNENNLIVM